MSKKRFLRDGVFDCLIDEVEDILHQIPEINPSHPYLFHYINSLVISFKTNHIVLERIEESIEYARKNDPTEEICVTLREAAVHLQTGILALHESFQINTAAIREGIIRSNPSD